MQEAFSSGLPPFLTTHTRDPKRKPPSRDPLGSGGGFVAERGRALKQGAGGACRPGNPGRLYPEYV